MTLGDVDMSQRVQDVPTDALMALLRTNERKTKINAIGKNTFAGDYKKIEGIYRDGDAELPFIIEAWATAEDAEKNNDDHTIEVITNRTLTLSRATLDVKSGRAKFTSGGYYRSHKGNGQCRQTKEYHVILAVSSPFIPFVSSSKEPRLLDTYGDEIMDVLQSTMKKAGAAARVSRTK